MMLYSHNPNSQSGELLAIALGCKRIRHEGSTFTGHKDELVINWGASKVTPEVMKCKILNPPWNVAKVVKRAEMFKSLSTMFPIPAFTEDQADVEAWVNNGATVEEKAGLWMMDVNPTSVFRLHNVMGKNIYTQFKTKNTVAPPDGTKALIKEATEEIRTLLGLHFCAITIGWNDKSNLFHVLDVNTAPEIDGSLAFKYGLRIKEML